MGRGDRRWRVEDKVKSVYDISLKGLHEKKEGEKRFGSHLGITIVMLNEMEGIAIQPRPPRGATNKNLLGFHSLATKVKF